MTLKIQYLRDGKLFFEIAWPRELPEAREFAAAGLVRHTAEYAAILDEDGNLVETVKDRA